MANHAKNINWAEYDEYLEETPVRNNKKNHKGYHDPAREAARQQAKKKRKAEKAKRLFENS